MWNRLPLLVLSCALLLGVHAGAWSGHEATAHGLRVFIHEIPDVAEPNRPTTVTVELENQSEGELAGTLEARDLVDAWRVVGMSEEPFRVAAGAKQELAFQIASGRPVYAALYPVHVYVVLGKGKTVHAVRIFRARKALPKVIPDAVPKELPVLRLAADGALALWRERDFQAGWKYYDGEPVSKPIRWQGSDAVSRASVSKVTLVRGDTRASINMHPPWIGGGGSVWADYRVQLPANQPIRLRFATAIRDHTEAEPGSDGVSYRVSVFEAIAPETPLFERFSAAKVWEEADVDLSRFAGKTVTVRLESHPGPERNTSCDSCYWARPLLLAGTAQDAVDAKPPGMPLQARELVQAVARRETKADKRQTFLLKTAKGSTHAAAVIPGKMGLLDGWFLFSDGKETTGFAGLRVEIEDAAVGTPPASFTCRKVTRKAIWGGMRYRHLLTGNLGDAELTVTVRAEDAGLRVQVASDRRISLLGPNAWDQPARRIYWGHGYVIDRPQAFRSSFGGHSLAASHVAFETPGGLAVLMASDTPPASLQVDPTANVQALYTRMNSTLTFVPAQGGMNAAIAYRPLYDKKPAGGVKRLSGRFCFDIWGGKYGQIRDRMQEAVRYGLTDSILTVHNWQRWGYDYQLPDIWPPNPAYGTVEELREVGQICRKQDIPWGLHDNYIDFYPDAANYSYEDIYFNRAGAPTPAWYNRGREAYSYKWRPDRIQPFVKRNFRLVKEGVAPTHSFLDVFTSVGCMDWWDWDGNFHSGLETRQHWGETFAWIRDYLGDNAPTTSEAGHDQLTGYLDGADCQWMTLAPQGRKHVIALKCGDWERVPWGSAVIHSRFIQHGVGYSTRYQGGRNRAVHGINSDDYMSMEALSGHALMSDSGSWGRAVTRKYYLLQDLARRLALREITASEFVGGDIHRQRVLWDEGTEVFVNRGASDWTVAGHVLPQYGFLARKGEWFVAVEKKGKSFAESARGESGWFCDARSVSLQSARRVFAKPMVENLKRKDAETFTYDCVWQVGKPQRQPWRTFVHFVREKDTESGKISFQNDHLPVVPTETWEPGMVRTPCTVTIPDDAKGRYSFLVGLFHPERGRAMLDGNQFGGSAILVGTLDIERDADGVKTVRFTLAKGADEEPELPPTNPQGTVVDFGFAKTSGACRIVSQKRGLRVIPLPKSPAFALALRLAQLADGKTPQVKSLIAIPLDEKAKPAPVPFKQTGDELGFGHDPTNFAYDIRW